MEWTSSSLMLLFSSSSVSAASLTKCDGWKVRRWSYARASLPANASSSEIASKSFSSFSWYSVHQGKMSELNLHVQGRCLSGLPVP